MADRPWLLVLSGLPGVGKSSLAREVARRTGAVWLRIDSIERGFDRSALAVADLMDAGYCAAAEVAGDNLALGLSVIADAVNPIASTRNLWPPVAQKANARLVEAEVICADRDAHRARVEARAAAEPGTPSWATVGARRYEPWSRPVLSVDTAAETAEGTAAALILSGGLG